MASQKSWYEVYFWLLVLVLTVSVATAYLLRFPWRAPHEPLAEFFIQEMTEKPFVYRVLPWLWSEFARLVVPLSPMVYHGALMAASLFGFTVALRVLGQHFWGVSRAVDYLVLFSIPLMILLSLDQQHTYDLPMLCLFTWGMVCIIQQRWTAFLVCYTIACFNKETTIFLTCIFLACCNQHNTSGRFMRLLAMQLSIYAISRIALMYIFRHNPGSPAPYTLPFTLEVYQHYLLKTGAYLVGIALVGALIAYRLREKPAFLVKAFFAAFIPTLFLFLLSGYPYEIRVFYEVYPLILLLCVPPRYAQLWDRVAAWKISTLFSSPARPHTMPPTAVWRASRRSALRRASRATGSGRRRPGRAN
ncbi:MAG: hypothetical protein OHK0022_59530 [Roseiflexaceae bacterium]